MTPLDAGENAPDRVLPPAFADAGAVMRVLAQVASLQAAVLGLLLAATFLTQANPGHIPVLDTLLRQGAPGIIGGGLVVSLSATLCCMLLTWGRGRACYSDSETKAANPHPGLRSRLVRRHLPRRVARRGAVTRLAGWPQGTLMLAGVALSCWLITWFQPLPTTDTDATIAWPGVAGLMLLPTFMLIVCERMVAVVGTDRLPESSRLAALLRIPIAVLLALSVLAAARGFGIAIPEIGRVLALPILAVDAELAVRALGPWFLPPPSAEGARAAIGSLLASVLQPETLRRTEIARRLRDQFGIDISRSWAVGYVRAAALPVVLGLLMLAWGLSGVTRIGLNERGSYERFGAPVAMLHPGLHAVLPWPFGRVRRVEFGVVHAVSIGADTLSGKLLANSSKADGAPPIGANRLWDQQTSTDSSYLIASRSGMRQSFATVSVEARVLYRVGMDDASARRALYGEIDPDGLVRTLSGRRLARFLADTTLAQVLGERRERISEQLRNDLQEELDRRHSGLEIAALVVKSMHPPSGAAVAYRSVQAAQIIASTQRAEEAGRAYGTLSEAARDARDSEDAAEGAAAEKISAAQIDRTQTDSDVVAYRSGGQAFSLERYFASLRVALGRGALEIVDHRLGKEQQPLIDLREPLAGASRGGVR